MTRILDCIIGAIVDTLAWLRACSPEPPETRAELMLQLGECILRLGVFLAILASLTYAASWYLHHIP